MVWWNPFTWFTKKKVSNTRLPKKSDAKITKKVKSPNRHIICRDINNINIHIDVSNKMAKGTVKHIIIVTTSEQQANKIKSITKGFRVCTVKGLNATLEGGRRNSFIELHKRNKNRNRIIKFLRIVYPNYKEKITRKDLETWSKVQTSTVLEYLHNGTPRYEKRDTYFIWIKDKENIVIDRKNK